MLDWIKGIFESAKPLSNPHKLSDKVVDAIGREDEETKPQNGSAIRSRCPTLRCVSSCGRCGGAHRSRQARGLLARDAWFLTRYALQCHIDAYENDPDH